jgi:hypothetical protein
MRMKNEKEINLKEETIKVLFMLSNEQIEDLTKNGKRYLYRINDKDYAIIDSPKMKICFGKDYNFTFNKTTGEFRRWGTTYRDDPQFSPVGPEILDLEISVNGCKNRCKFCYKNNTDAPATNMSFDAFKSIIDKMPKTLTQVAFGITGIQTNPHFFKMMEYCREIGVIPNFTLSGIDLTDELAEKTAKWAGAVAVSAYQTDKNICYNTVKKFTDLGMKQVNIHLMVSEESLDFVYEVINDRISDPRLSKLNAIVFLGVKPKGRAKDNYNSLSVEKYVKLVNFCFEKKINIGFDSCSAPKFEEAVRKMEIPDAQKEMLIGCSESCESSLFSAYINVIGKYWHCSFSENENGQECVDVLIAKDFISHVWYSPAVKTFRAKSLEGMKNGCRYCHVFPSINP